MIASPSPRKRISIDKWTARLLAQREQYERYREIKKHARVLNKFEVMELQRELRGRIWRLE